MGANSVLPGGGEDEALGLLARLLPAAPPGQTWYGDDAAVVTVPGGGPHLLLALDTVVAGLDADLSLTSLADLGWKALAVNLSDIAAMGGAPACALVGVSGLGTEALSELYEGLLEASAHYRCPVVGGDLSGGEQAVVSVAVAGWSHGPPVLRSGARPGDTIWVTSPLGAAAAGLRCLREAAAGAQEAGRDQGAGPGARPGGLGHPQGASRPGFGQVSQALVSAHARPVPALAEGSAARECGATAMIDVSDGLAVDLSRLADSSGVGFELAHVPVAPGATLEEALGGGDDYALLFTLPPGLSPVPVFEAAGLRAPCRLGSCVADASRRQLAGSPLAPLGWEHRLPGADVPPSTFPPLGPVTDRGEQ